MVEGPGSSIAVASSYVVLCVLSALLVENGTDAS